MSWERAGPFVVGHRGAPREAPENTLASFRAAVAAGAPAIELDARLSSDGEVVVHHDPALGRVLPGAGLVERLSARELRAAGAPTLADVLRALPDTLVDVELKADAENADALPARVADVLAREGAVPRVVVSSFDPALADACAEACGASAGFIVPFPVAPEDVAEFRRIRHVMLVQDAAEPEAVAALAKEGYHVHVWTVNDEATARAMWARGARGVITDEPGRLARLLRASSGPSRP